MPLSPEMLFNELNGEETKEILFTRLAHLLNGVPDFNRNLTLPRVRMKLSISLEITGRNPPTIDIKDDLIVRMRDDIPPAGAVDTFKSEELSAEIISDTTLPEGQPPDEIRVEHGVPVMEPQRGPMGMEDVPVLRKDGVKYAAFIEQDYGPARQRTGQEGPVVGGEIISQKGRGASTVSPDFSKVNTPGYVDSYKPGDTNHNL